MVWSMHLTGGVPEGSANNTENLSNNYCMVVGILVSAGVVEESRA